MSHKLRTYLALGLTLLTSLTGCHPTQPFYWREDGDLSHWIEHQTRIDYPDSNESCILPDAIDAHAPVSLDDNPEPWELTLEECVHHALQNNKVIVTLGGSAQFGSTQAQPGIPDNSQNSPTVYDTALSETTQGVVSRAGTPASFDGPARANQVGGVESALSQFDAAFDIASAQGQNGSLFSTTNRPQNVVANPLFPFFTQVLRDDSSNVASTLSKRSATGDTWFLRNITSYDRGNSRGGIFSPDGSLNPNRNQALNSFWSTEMELEWNAPLLRGRGVLLNRIPVMLARLNTDISLTQFESGVRNQVMDIEKEYWDLYFQYRNLATAKAAQDSAQETWRTVNARAEGGRDASQAARQASETYFTFSANVMSAKQQLLDTEQRLRLLMGIAPSDGRIIRPRDEPLLTRVEFDWGSIKAEALVRSPEIRAEKWAIKQRELELMSAKNQLLPRLDFRTEFRWVGVGDNLINADRNGLDFPARGSTAFDELTSGKYHEFSIGLDFEPPRWGARREMAGVRSAELALRRTQEQLKQLELTTVHQLTISVRNADTLFKTATMRFNAYNELEAEIVSLKETVNVGRSPVDDLLRAQQRRAQAQSDYYRALTEYMKQIAFIHFRKGSLLEYNNIQLAEGPWPEKAYWDALGRARERDAGTYIDYGFTRPGVVSRGEYLQQMGTDLGIPNTAPSGIAPSGIEPTPAAAPDAPGSRNSQPGDDEPEEVEKPKLGPITGRQPARHAVAQPSVHVRRSADAQREPRPSAPAIFRFDDEEARPVHAATFLAPSRLPDVEIVPAPPRGEARRGEARRVADDEPARSVPTNPMRSRR